MAHCVDFSVRHGSICHLDNWCFHISVQVREVRLIGMGLYKRAQVFSQYSAVAYTIQSHCVTVARRYC